jgi:regulator of protease activity HflC (stomatin/prohibitin superfamily)
MKSTYEKRWGHPRTKKAVKHLEAKARKQAEAKARNEAYAASERAKIKARLVELTCLSMMANLH